MSEEENNKFFDLLTKKAIYGLDDLEQRELDAIDGADSEAELFSLERTVAAISLIGIEADKPLPSHLFARIADEAGDYIDDPKHQTAPIWGAERSREQQEEGTGSPWFAWLGWAVAAAACIALAVNIFVMRPQPPEVAQVPPQTDAPRVLTPGERREEMLRSAVGIVKAEWAAGNVKDIKSISGDVVWSDELQAGYMRFRGLPANDPGKETYQLWIFDKTQDKATPIDGGTFDVTIEGEVVVPINAKLKAQGPEMFAVTVEKPGGVVVSSREKIAALAKVETRSS